MIRGEVAMNNILEALRAANICYQTFGAQGAIAHVKGGGGEGGRCIVLYADSCNYQSVLNVVVDLAATADFEGSVYAFFAGDDSCGELEQSYFVDMDVTACIMPMLGDGILPEQIGLSCGKVLASRDELTIKVASKFTCDEVALDRIRVVEALADLMMRIKGLESEDCKIQIRNVVAQSVNTPIPLNANVESGIYCLKDGVRSSVMQMINNTITELEYKYEVALDAVSKACEPCVENDSELIGKAVTVVHNAGYQVQECGAVFSSHRFGYLSRRFPSLMYYYCGDALATNSEFLRSVVLDILNR